MDQGLEHCRRCGSRQNLTFAHIVPYALGGRRTMDNIGILCGPCNEAHGDQIDTELRSLLDEESARSPEERWSVLWMEANPRAKAG